jgi:hypothetical protein
MWNCIYGLFGDLTLLVHVKNRIFLCHNTDLGGLFCFFLLLTAFLFGDNGALHSDISSVTFFFDSFRYILRRSSFDRRRDLERGSSEGREGMGPVDNKTLLYVKPELGKRDTALR